MESDKSVPPPSPCNGEIVALGLVWKTQTPLYHFFPLCTGKGGIPKDRINCSAEVCLQGQAIKKRMFLCISWGDAGTQGAKITDV